MLLCNLVLNSASALLEVPLHLVQLLLATLQHWLMAGVAKEEGEDGLAVEEHVESQVDIKQVEAHLVTWPATSPTNLATSEPSEVGWRCTVKRAPSFEWGQSLREKYFDRVQNSFNPSNLFVVVRPKDCWHHQVLTHVVPFITITKVCRRFSRLQCTKRGDSR